jgi:oligopeptide transport system ATP-binding protein
MQMIFQDPMSSLNPRKKIIDIVAEGLDANHLCKSSSEREEKVCAILERVGLSREFACRYPHMFSGGQRQRVGIARAMIMEPDLIIADECISALDVSIQAQVVNLMKDLQAERKLTYLFIAHDLSMVKYISDDIGVIHLGHLVETGTKADIFEHPIHPYTKSLLSAIPEPNPLTERSKKSAGYNRAAEGIDYLKGTEHYITPTHMVLGTDEELGRWTV